MGNGVPRPSLAELAAAAAGERRNQHSRLAALPQDVFDAYLARRYLQGGPRAVHIATLANVDYCTGMCVLPASGELAVIGGLLFGTLQRFAPDGTEQRDMRRPLAAPGPRGVCQTRSGGLAVAYASGVAIYTLHGKFQCAFGLHTSHDESPAARDASLPSLPPHAGSDIALDLDGNLVVCDPNYGQLIVLTETGELVRVVSEDGPFVHATYGFTPDDPGTRGRPVAVAARRLARPYAVAVHPDLGHYYVAESECA